VASFLEAFPFAHARYVTSLHLVKSTKLLRNVKWGLGFGWISERLWSISGFSQSEPEAPSSFRACQTVRWSASLIPLPGATRWALKSMQWFSELKQTSLRGSKWLLNVTVHRGGMDENLPGLFAREILCDRAKLSRYIHQLHLNHLRSAVGREI
jgi:hypothetical protein